MDEKYPLNSPILKYSSLIEGVFVNHTNSQITGKEAHLLYETLNKEAKRDSSPTRSLVTEYSNAIEQLGRQLSELQELAQLSYTTGASLR